MANVIRTFSTYGWPAGLTDLAFVVKNTSGSTVTATGTVTEDGGGNYSSNVTMDEAVSGKIEWASATVPGGKGQESFPAAVQRVDVVKVNGEAVEDVGSDQLEFSGEGDSFSASDN